MTRPRTDSGAAASPPTPGKASDTQDPAARDAAATRRSLLGNPWLWAVLAGLILIPAMRPFLSFEPAPPPTLFALPEFSLLDQGGNSFGSQQLEGTVYVASFIFTRCTTICPVVTSAVQRLAERYRVEGVEGVDLVSFSVDPEFDTPAVLREYALRRNIDGERWHLLTGSKDEVQRLVVDGFKTPMGPVEMGHSEHSDAQHGEEPAPTLIDIAHTGRLVLVDGGGGIRGYYDVSIEGLDEVFYRSQHVLAERRWQRSPSRGP